MKESLSNREHDLAAQLRREYQREWRRRNREKVKEYNRSYWSRKAEAQREGGKNDDHV
jgi:hypothetical protein